MGSRSVRTVGVLILLCFVFLIGCTVEAVEEGALLRAGDNMVGGPVARGLTIADPKVFEFFTNSYWNLYQREFMPWDVDFTRVTHLLYGFFGVGDSCEVEAIDDGFIDFKYKFHEMGMDGPEYSGALGLVGAFKTLQDWVEEAGLTRFKLIASIGGWYLSSNFHVCAGAPASRTILASSIAQFLIDHGFDGVNINWQWPGPFGIDGQGDATDYANYQLLVSDLRSALGAGPELSVVQGMSPPVLEQGDGNLCQLVDYMVLQAYDYNGYWNDQTGFNAPILPPVEGDPGYCVQAGVAALIATGCPASKMVLGVPAFGTCWSGVEPGPNGDGLWQNGPTACHGTNESGKVKFYDMYTEEYPLEHRYFDHDSMAPYWYREGVFVSFDDAYTVGLKANLAKEANFGGIMLFEAVDDKLTVDRTSVDLGHGLGLIKQYVLLSSSVNGWDEPPTTTTTQPPTTSTSISNSSTTQQSGNGTTTTQPPTTTPDHNSVSTTVCPDGGGGAPWYNLDRYMNKFINLYLDRINIPEYLEMYVDRFIHRYIGSPRGRKGTTSTGASSTTTTTPPPITTPPITAPA